MFKNYLKTAFRNIRRNKLFTFLNILGLSLGMATAILIFFWVQDEMSYDKHFKNHENIYRVFGDYYMNGVNYHFATAPPTMAAAMINDYPEVLNACRFRDVGSVLVTIEDKKYEEPNAIYADSTMFDVFSIPIVSGNKSHLLNKAGYAVINEKLARKYFGEESAVGKTIIVDDKNFIIAGVIENIPANTHFSFEIILSMYAREESFQQSWLSNNFQTYIVLHPETNIDDLVDRFQDMILKYLGPDIERVMGTTVEEFLEESSAAFDLQKLTNIHLHSDLMAELEANSDIKYVYIFSFIAIFILIIACINFMNMATARSEGKAKEVGIRKVSGAVRSQVLIQYIVESLLFTLFSYILAMIMVELVLPEFNTLAGKEISIEYNNPSTLFSLLGIIIITGLVAGSYPALYLSSFRPIVVLKGGFKSGRGSGRLRNSLVVVQLLTTIILISSTIIVYQQMNYIQNKNIGYNKEQLISIHNTHLLGESIQTFKKEMLSYPQFKSATISSFLPVPSSSNNSAVWPDGIKERVVSIQQWTVDYDYIKTMEMKIIEGRDFNSEMSTDSLAVIINQTTAKQFGWADPLNHKLDRLTWPDAKPLTYNVIGVVEDFNFHSLRDNIGPLMMYINKSPYTITFRFEAEDTRNMVNLLEQKWMDFVPNELFDYSFVDNRFSKVYFREQRISKIITIFSILAIIIASLGLFGLTAFTTEKRTKEIGIRKVNGASVMDIFRLLAKDFVKLVIIAFVIAVPPTWYYMENWLDNFAYRVNLNFYIFILSGILAFVLAIATIAYQAFKAATLNPVESLKYE
ncbi:MAG: ABC transporter permease [Bacteroidales bacterium]|nr:ABC transporter permease [Bacteroidales bacterium]